MKTVKIISGIMLVIAYISLAVAGFMDYAFRMEVFQREETKYPYLCKNRIR